ncbi:MAG: 2,3-bisphosphoglycerate-independent phosphoglycerate mutase [Patescibacteria group bacterium]
MNVIKFFMTKKPIVLAILDGWGVGKLDESNPIYRAEPETMNFIRANFPAGALQSSGIAIGLPWEEEGNSEVGHLTIGAGKILYQHFPRISLAIKNGSFFKNSILLAAMEHAKKNNSTLHLVGLLTDANIHASLEHLEALIKMAREEKCPNISLHLFSDGRDTEPRSVLKLLSRLSDDLKFDIHSILTTLSGRYYAMDRDKHWDRTEKTYQILTGTNPAKIGLEEAVKKAYDLNLNDEYVEPTVVANEPRFIRENDAVICFNFREDRMRQLSETFIDPNFGVFPVKKFTNLYFATFTNYDARFAVPIAFPEEAAENPLGKILSDNGKRQLRIAETEKYAHVTYFFNGLKEKPFPDEFRILVPSENAVHYEQYPQMMAGAVTDRVIAALAEGTYDFILVNYANPDMVAHTGNYEATLKAISIVDQGIKKIMEGVLDQDGVLIVTSDHGNAEVLIDLKTGEAETKHNPNPVPFYLVGDSFKRSSPIDPLAPLPVLGMLSDVAPTILELMKIPQPTEMTGQSLLPQLLS